MSRAKSRLFPFGPLAIALILAAVVTPFARDLGTRLEYLHRADFQLAHKMRQEIGAELSTLTPYIEVIGTLRRETDTDTPSPRALRLYPTTFSVEIDQSTHRARRGDLWARWMTGDIRMTVRFASQQDLSEAFEPGGEPDWSSAALKLPYHAPQSLDGPAEIVVDGQSHIMFESPAPRNYMTLDHPLTTLPADDVVISYRRKAVGPNIVIRAGGRSADIEIISDSRLMQIDGLGPDRSGGTILGSRWLWSFEPGVDPKAYRTPTRYRANPAVFGVSEDRSDPIVLQNAELLKPFTMVAFAISFVPMSIALTALVLFVGRVPGILPYLGLFVIASGALAVTYIATIRLGDFLGWYAGAVVIVTGVLVVLWRYGYGTAIPTAMVFAAGWTALLHVPYEAYSPAAPYTPVVFLSFGQPISFTLGVLAGLYALSRLIVGYSSRDKTPG